MTKSKWLNSTVLGASITSFFSDLSHEAVTVLLPAFLILLGAPVYALGLVEGISDGLSSFTKLVSGYFSDKLRKRKEIATVGYIATGIFPSIVAVANSWFLVLFARAFGWIGRGARGPPRDAILANSVAKKYLGKVFGFHRAGDTLGAMAGPILALSLLSFLNIREIFWLTVIPGVLAVLTFWFLVKERNKSSFEGKPFTISLKNFSGKFKNFITAVSIFGIADFSHTLLILFAVTTLTPSMGLAKATGIGVLLYTVRNIVYAVLSYPFGALGDKFGRRKMLALGYALAVATFVGFMLSPHSVIYYVILFALAGAFVAAEDTLEGAVAGELVEEKIRSLGFGILATSNGIGDFISSVVVGLLWSLFGFSTGFAYSALMGFTGMFTLILVNNRSK